MFKELLAKIFRGNQPPINPLVSASEPTPTSSPTPTPTMFPFMGRNPAIKQQINQEKAQPILKSIYRATGDNNVFRSLLEDIIMQESRFNPTVVNSDPNSTATGLMQFTDPTWRDMIKSYPDIKSYSQRIDPFYNVKAGVREIQRGRLGRWDASKPVWGQYYTPEELKSLQYE